MNLWEQQPQDAAHGLLGKTLIVGNYEATVLVADGYPRSENTTNGLYGPILEAVPGTVYCPRHRNSVLLLIATHDQGEPGGCVLIRAAEVQGVIYRGPGRVSERLELREHGTTGVASSIDEDTFLVKFGEKTVHTPRTSSASRGNQLGKATLAELMPFIVARYLKVSPEGVTFQDFLNNLLEVSADKKQFLHNLRQYGKE